MLISYAAAVGEAYLRRLEWSSAAMSNGVQLVNTHSDSMTRALNDLEENLDQTSRGAVLQARTPSLLPQRILAARDSR